MRTAKTHLHHIARRYRARWPTLARAGLFCLVGLSGLVVDMGAFLGLSAAGVDHRTARALSFWPAVTWTWFGNRRVTFADRRTGAAPTPQWARFACAAGLGAAINIGAYLTLTALVPWFGAHRAVALLAGVACGASINFTLASKVVFPAPNPKRAHPRAPTRAAPTS